MTSRSLQLMVATWTITKTTFLCLEQVQQQLQSDHQ